jgi:hypothetical protein
MTHARSHQFALAVLAIAVPIAMALALGATTGPASARTFDYPSGGSLVQHRSGRANSAERWATGSPPVGGRSVTARGSAAMAAG